MANERVVEIPWALNRLPQSGRVLDVGSCDATYLGAIPQPDRTLECLDPRPCAEGLPSGVGFVQESIFGNRLAPHRYDAILLLSVLEHMGLPTYGQRAVPDGDRRAIVECRRLLRPCGILLATVPAGRGKVTSWYRQYTPGRIEELFTPWSTTVEYFGLVDDTYSPIAPADVTRYDYRDRCDGTAGAGAVACIHATAPAIG